MAKLCGFLIVLVVFLTPQNGVDHDLIPIDGPFYVASAGDMSKFDVNEQTGLATPRSRSVRRLYQTDEPTGTPYKPAAFEVDDLFALAKEFTWCNNGGASAEVCRPRLTKMN